MAPQRLAPRPEPGPQKGEETVDAHTISPAGDPFHAAPHDDQDEHPHACNDGWVTLGQIVVDPETGEEMEEFALYLCRRCADSR